MNSRRSSALLVWRPIAACLCRGAPAAKRHPARLGRFSSQAPIFLREFGKALACDSKRVSPDLSWNSSTANTHNFALIVTDWDSSLGYNFVHWVIYNIPASARELPGGLSTERNLPGGTKQGINDDEKTDCVLTAPPASSFHRYDFSYVRS